MLYTILLFDMDGVLLHADGYHRALQASVKLIGQNIGIEEPILSKEHIAQFEAAGVTHEWETLAICTVILLIQIWFIDEKVRIPDIINPEPIRFLINGEDKFDRFLRDIDLNGISPTIFAESYFFEQEHQLSRDQKEYLNLILRHGSDFEISPIYPVFQEYVLGSQMFSQLYQITGNLNTKSYLDTFDRNAISEKNLTLFNIWLQSDFHRAAIFTNRPSQPPAGFFSTPEAEIGAEAIGLPNLPIIGAGALSWLANLKSKPIHSFYKPSPVHALAAFQAAIGNPLDQSLNTAFDLIYGSQNRKSWLPLDGSKIYIFEDMVGGFISAQTAQELLQKIGVKVDLYCVGISKHHKKIKSLSSIANCIVENLNQGIFHEIIS